MEKLLRKVKKLLRDRLPGTDLEFDVTVPGHKVGGTVIWDGFDGIEPIERADRVWDILDHGLSVDERRSINVILTLTPDEMAAARHG